MSDAPAIVVHGLILAGGLSRRMGGGQKALLPLGNRPIIARVLERLAPQVAEVAINANADGYAGFGVPVLADTVAGFVGPLAGVLAGLNWASTQGADYLTTVAADTPFFPGDLVSRLSAQAVPGRVVMARNRDGVQPVFALWPVTLRGALEQWLHTDGSRKVQDFAAAFGLDLCDFAAAGGAAPFFNVNRPEDLAQAEAMLR
ncbi:molybdenum cofactor guanylyltransferase [mine drainage metagenome]|uniref:Molybdenum cofactor guanylyltransferase n=1 Tax=mine drainage metagenome TaxID=410659 RepID=A0A1J5PI71_9ZZZZ